MRKTIFLLIAVFIGISGQAKTNTLIDSIKNELSRATTVDDSLRLSLDLYDLSKHDDRINIAEKLYHDAERWGKVDVQIELLQYLANTNSIDSLYDVYLSRIDKLPNTTDQQLTKLFIKIRQSSTAARTASVETSHEHIRDLIQRAEISKGRTNNTRLQVLFTLCAYLEQVSSGELLSGYLMEIEYLLERQPKKLEVFESLYLTQKALTYTATGDYAKAVETDKHMLELIDSLQKKYTENGRRFHNLKHGQYMVYRRLLSNYKALTNEEVELYFKKILGLKKFDPVLKADFEKYRRPEIYYYMAKKDYAKALPLLKKDITLYNDNQRLYVRKNLVENLIEAAEALNDRESLVEGLLENRKLQNDELVHQSTEQFKELQAIYDTNSQQLRNAQEELDKRNIQIESHKITIILSTVFLLILLSLLGFTTRLWQKSKKLNKQLSMINARLTEERDSLKRVKADLIHTGERARIADKQREQFINNISHEVSTPLNAIVEYSQLIVDCIDDTKKPYLLKFANIVKLNSELIMTLVNDVLDLASIDKKTLKIEKHPIVVSSLAEVAADSVRRHLNKDVSLINNIETDYNLIINTDPKRLTQILYNLLINAAKFTNEGSVMLDGHTVDNNNFYEFSVTDTGIGIPEGKEEIIFNRFEKLNRSSAGIGLGLAVSRMLATLLGGELKVDTSYRRGARFILTIPTK